MPEGQECCCVTRLVELVDTFDLLVNSRTLMVVECRVCLRLLYREWLTVGLPREVENMVGICSFDKVLGVVPKPHP